MMDSRQMNTLPLMKHPRQIFASDNSSSPATLRRGGFVSPDVGDRIDSKQVPHYEPPKSPTRQPPPLPALPEIRFLPTGKDDEFYNFRFPSRVVILCITSDKQEANREKSENGMTKDREIAVRFFERIGFAGKDYVIRKGITWDEAKKFMAELSESDFSDCSSLICCVLCRNGSGIYREPEKLWEPFCNSTFCRSLVGKPKIFIIQACIERSVKIKQLFGKGDAKDRGDDQIRHFTAKLPKFSDLLVVLPMKANIGGEIEEEDETPSRFIECLGESLDLTDSDSDVTELLRCLDSQLEAKTAGDLRQGPQMAQVSSTLLHRIPLYPDQCLIPQHESPSQPQRGARVAKKTSSMGLMFKKVFTRKKKTAE